MPEHLSFILYEKLKCIKQLLSLGLLTYFCEIVVKTFQGEHQGVGMVSSRQRASLRVTMLMLKYSSVRKTRRREVGPLDPRRI